MLLLVIEEPSTDYELFSADSFTEFVVVDVDESEFHSFLFFAVIVVEFHFGEEELGIVVVLHFEITSFRHESYDFGGVGSDFVAGVVIDGQAATFWVIEGVTELVVAGGCASIVGLGAFLSFEGLFWSPDRQFAGSVSFTDDLDGWEEVLGVDEYALIVFFDIFPGFVGPDEICNFAPVAEAMPI